MTVAPPSVTLGGYLRALREERGASLEDMAQSTRVSIRQLEALEMEEFSELPAPVFVKGFIRAYCHYLNVSSDEALARYRDILGEPAVTQGPVFSGRRPTWSTSPIFISLLLLVVFGAGLLALNLVWKRQPRATAARTVPATAPAPAPAPRPVSPSPVVVTAPTNVPAPAPAPAPAASVAPNTGAPPHTVASSPPGGGPAVAAPPARPSPPPPAATPPAPSAADTTGLQRLSVKATEETWLRVQMDDGRVFEDVLPAGTTREWTTSKGFVLTIGNAGGVELMLNGRVIPPLGPRGAVIRRLELPQAASTTGS